MSYWHGGSHMVLSLHIETRVSIELQPVYEFGVRDCGCENVRNDVARIRLCQYHQGYNDAFDIIRG